MRIVQGSWKVPIGRTYYGRPVLLDLDFAPHTKIAGITGSGKSEAMKSLLYFLCQQLSPQQLEIHIIDLKGGATFAQFELLPHVRGVYRDTRGALEALTYCAAVMWQRLDEIRRDRLQFLEIKRYPMLLVLIDEGEELSPADAIGTEKAMRQACMDVLSSLVRVGREPGLRVVYGTQRPDKYTLPMTIRSQLENVLCFRVREKYDSEIVLGHEGAEQLPKIPGRMIFQSPKGEIPVQGVYVPPHVLEAWLRHYANVDEAEASCGEPSTLSTVGTSSHWGD
jgi:S-DNA-T family DNA segregation ATPase FtsK/SpoIIIE